MGVEEAYAEAVAKFRALDDEYELAATGLAAAVETMEAARAAVQEVKARRDEAFETADAIWKEHFLITTRGELSEDEKARIASRPNRIVVGGAEERGEHDG